MDKTKRDFLVAAALVVLFLFLVGRNFLPKKTEPAVPGQSANASAGTDRLALMNIILQDQRLREEQHAASQGQWGRDPFVAGNVTGSSQASNFILSGVVWDAEMPIAIINGNVYKPGDTIEGYRVEKIGQASVTLQKGEEKVILELFAAAPSAQ